MSNQKFAKRTQEVLKNLGHEISLGHAYEFLAGLAGFKSWNEAKAKNADLTLPFIRKSKGFEFYIVEDVKENPLVIKDRNEGGCSVTNSAREVVIELMNQGLLPIGRRLFYFDTMGIKDEMLRDELGRFKGFAPGPDRKKVID